MGFGVVLFLVLIILICAAGSGKNKQVNFYGTPSAEPLPKLKESHEVIVKEAPDPAGEPMSKFSCNIAGLQYHQDNIKLGGFVGFGYPEPWNFYDPKAVAISNCYVKLMGYVPAKAQDEYSEYYPDRSPAIVVGYVSNNVEGKLSGKAYFIRIHSWEYAKSEVESLTDWLKSKKKIDSFWGYDVMMKTIEEKIRGKYAENDTKMKESAATN